MSAKNKRTVAILGWYGHHNFGDELVQEGMRQLFKDWNITFLSDTKNIYSQFNADIVNKHDLFVLGGGELINSDRLFFGSNWIRKVKVP
jgi:exopolysaccharide biosynthesis predicted pyruvyltransferase EpsI